MGNSFSTETWRRLCKSSLQLLTLQKATKWALAKLCFHSRAFPRPPVILYSRLNPQTLFQLHKWAHHHNATKRWKPSDRWVWERIEKRKTPGCQLSVCVTMCSSKDSPIQTELLRIFSGAVASLVSITVDGSVTVLIWLIFKALRWFRNFSHSVRMRLGFCPAEPRNWKWPYGVGNSQMSIIWCISITNNMKTCKKFNERAQTAKFSVFSRLRQELCAENPKNKENKRN